MHTNVIADTFHQFWRRHPALLYGIAFTFGTAFAIGAHWVLALPALFILFPLIIRPQRALQQRLCLAIAVAVTAFLYTYSTLTIPTGDIPTQGKGIVTFSTITKKQKFSREIWEYRGTIQSFIDNTTGLCIAKNAPCVISLNLKKGASRPIANQNYLIEGSLIPPRGYYSRLQSKQQNWKPVPHTFSFAECRYEAKQVIGEMIKNNVTDRRVYEFLKGIATGDFQDEELQYEFSRFGLQHIMAISGFHFAIIAGFFVFFIRLFAPRKVAALLLVFLMCSYFVFLGPSPSIMRAWMMILIVLGACFSERLSNGLNSLGVAILSILFFDPSMVCHIGFQFSCLITAAILLSYSTFDYFLQRLFAKRPLYEVIDMSMRDQHGYLILATMRKVLALSFTVNLLAAPLAIYYFQKFPLLGLVYNWFFPFMVSISIALLLVALLIGWIPPLAAFIHGINMKYTSAMLDIVYNMPVKVDIYVRSNGLDTWFIIAFVSSFFITAIFLRYFVEKSCQERKDFAFI